MFSPGGKYKTRRVGADKFRMSIPLRTDSEGMLARDCPSPSCTPGYFKVKLGSGIVDGTQVVCFCPYCGTDGDPQTFHTKEQVKHAESIVMQQAEEAVAGELERLFGLDQQRRRKVSAGGLLNVSLEIERGPGVRIYHPREDSVRRNAVCPHCHLDHAVFGLGIWCPDCGEDIFENHIVEEIAVIRKILEDVPRREQTLGRRVAAKDLENALEDIVSLFEAALKFVVRRTLALRHDDETVQRRMKKIGNGFQNPKKSEQIIQELFGIDLFQNVQQATRESLMDTLSKRHPITHNLGIVDKKFIAQSGRMFREGRDVPLSVDEVERAITATEQVLIQSHKALASLATNRDDQQKAD